MAWGPKSRKRKARKMQRIKVARQRTYHEAPLGMCFMVVEVNLTKE